MLTLPSEQRKAKGCENVMCDICGGSILHRSGCPEVTETETCIICGTDDDIEEICETPVCTGCLVEYTLDVIADEIGCTTEYLIKRLVD